MRVWCSRGGAQPAGMSMIEAIDLSLGAEPTPIKCVARIVPSTPYLAHSEGADEPAGHELPMGHVEHAAAPADEKVPAAQTAQTLLSAAAAYPASHALAAAEPVGHAAPAGQAMHAPAPADEKARRRGSVMGRAAAKESAKKLLEDARRPASELGVIVDESQPALAPTDTSIADIIPWRIAKARGAESEEQRAIIKLQALVRKHMAPAAAR